MHFFTGSNRQVSAAFTLLELIMSVALTGVLAVAAFTLTNGAIQMGVEVSDDQRRTLEVQRCLAILRSNFESLPGNARLELLADRAGSDNFSELRIFGAPEAFRPGGTLIHSDVISIIGNKGKDEDVRLSLRYDTFGDTENSNASKFLPLMGGLSEIEWRFYSQSDGDWFMEWEERHGKPRLIELNLMFGDAHDPIREVFWLPPVVNPKKMGSRLINMNQLSDAPILPAPDKATNPNPSIR